MQKVEEISSASSQQSRATECVQERWWGVCQQVGTGGLTECQEGWVIKELKRRCRKVVENVRLS